MESHQRHSSDLTASGIPDGLDHAVGPCSAVNLSDVNGSAPGDSDPADRTLDEQANWCFGCGPDNPSGLHLVFTLRTDACGQAIACAPVRLTRAQEGPPGYLHGGIIATLLDEAMSKLNRPLRALAMTRSLTVDYLRPAPMDTPLCVTATHMRREGRKLFHRAVLAAQDGTELARAHGLFVVIEPALLALRQS